MRTHRRSTHVRLLAALAAGLAAFAAAPARAAFQTPLYGPAPAARGGSSVGSLKDSSVLFLNPAAASGLESVEAYLAYSQLYAGLPGVGSIGRTFVSAGVPTKAGTLSLGFGDFSGAGLLNERVVGVSFARRLFGGVDAGVTAKYLSHKYLIGSDPLAASDPVFRNGTSRGAFAFDVGAAARLSDSLTAGVSVRNVNSPDVGLATPDRVPREYQAGVAYLFHDWDLKATADFLYRDSRDLSSQSRDLPSVGLEKTFEKGMLALRAGADPDQFAAGFGVHYGPFDFDYAFLLPRLLATAGAGTHQVGIRYRFGGH